MEITYFCEGKGCALKQMCKRYMYGLSLLKEQGKWIEECGEERLGWVRN